MTTTLRIGTRKSALALAQTDAVSSAFKSAGGVNTSVSKITTSGDRRQTRDRIVGDDKKDWVLEIEQALVAGEIDCAVHSAKDVPVEIDRATTLIPVFERADPRDALLVKPGTVPEVRTLSALAPGVAVGTTSLRRKAQLLRLRSDLNIVPLRGNVPTRIQKLRDEPELDAAILACAGLHRLGMEAEAGTPLDPDEFLPAVNQGILVVQFLTERTDIAVLLSSLVNQETEAAWHAERACIEALGADCSSAVGTLAFVDGSELELRARVLSTDGTRCIEERIRAPLSSARQSGLDLGRVLLDQGAADILKAES